ncbi:hypothetical protein ACFOUP_09005, partial [Belliella kenyensis]
SSYPKSCTEVESSSLFEMISGRKTDNLTYTYAKGNQLSKVTDATVISSGFKDGANVADEYLYDPNED